MHDVGSHSHFQSIEARGIKQLIDKPHKNVNSSPLFA